MEALHEVTRTQLVEIFTRWNKQAREGGWEKNEFNAEESATRFLAILDEVRADG